MATMTAQLQPNVHLPEAQPPPPPPPPPPSLPSSPRNNNGSELISEQREAAEAAVVVTDSNIMTGGSSSSSTRRKKFFPPRSSPLPPRSKKPPLASSSSRQRSTPEDDDDNLSASFRPDFSNLSDLNLEVDALQDNTWGGGGDFKDNSLDWADGVAHHKTCLSTPPALALLWKRSAMPGAGKIASVDVASVGNASDTLVSIFLDEQSTDSQQQRENNNNVDPALMCSTTQTTTMTTSHKSKKSSTTATNASNRQRLSGRDLHESAKSHLNAGDYPTALEYFDAVLKAQMQRFGEMHPSVGAAMHNVGVCRQRMQQYDLAVSSFVRAVEIRRATLGMNHLEVAASLSKLGAARASLKVFDEAFEDLLQAIAIAKMQLGREHKTVAQMLCHLGCFYFEAGELFAAQATFLDAYEIYRIIFPQATDRNACMAQMTDTLCNIGSIQNRRKRFASAIDTFTEALDLQRGIMGHDHPRVVATLDNLGYSYSKNKDYANALSCYKKMYRAQVENSTTFTEECFETFQKQLVMYEKLKKIPEAIEVTKETLHMQKSLLPRQHKIISQTKEILEELNKKQKRKGKTSSSK